MAPNETNEICFNRLSDKYHGMKMCEMTHSELEEFLGGIARRGAADALKAVGLADESAYDDIRDIRDLLKGFKLVRREAWSTAVSGMGRMIGWAFILAMAAFMLHNGSPTVRQAAQHLMEP